jgi:hypothetical protein
LQSAAGLFRIALRVAASAATGLNFPLSFLGFFFNGPRATLLLLAMMALLAAAIGLLKLKRWGLLATTGLQCLTLLNFLLIVAIPANRLKFQQVVEAMKSSCAAYNKKNAGQMARI